jgi:Cu-Zn family superoxide dismutase
MRNIQNCNTFQQSSTSDPVVVVAQVTGLTSGSKHGFHIHQWGDLSMDNNGTSAGLHFDVDSGHQHAIPGFTRVTRHTGDMVCYLMVSLISLGQLVLLQ